MESIHGHRPMSKAPDRLWQTPDGQPVARLPLGRRVHGAPSAAKPIPIPHGNIAILRLRRPMVVSLRVRACASAYSEAYYIPNPSTQNRSSDPTSIARSVSLGAHLPGAAAPLFRNRIVMRAFTV